MRLPLLAVLALLAAAPALAGDPAPAATPAAVDWRQAELDDGAKATLKDLGYRLEEDGRVLSPEKRAPLSAAELSEVLARARMASYRAGLERLNLLLADAGDGKLPDATRLKAQGLAADLPPEVAKLLDDPKSTAAQLRALAGAGLAQTDAYFDGRRTMAERRDAARPVSAAHGGKSAPPPYLEDSERRLGEAMRSATAAQLGKYPVGREVLGRLKGKDGKPDLPPMLVDATGSAVAVYDYRRRAIVVDQEVLTTSIVEDFPAQERPTIRRTLDTRAKLLAYLESHPDALTSFTRKNDVVIAHELTHAWQDRRDPLLREMIRGNLPAAEVLEYEDEAYFEKNRYLHSKLKTDPASVADDEELRDYLAMMNGYAEWRDALHERYTSAFPATAMGLSDARAIQARRLAATKARPAATRQEQEAKALDLTGLTRAERAVRKAEDDHLVRLKESAKTYSTMAAEDPGLLARFYLEQALGAPNQIEFSVRIVKAEEYAVKSGDQKLLEHIRSLKGRKR